MEKFYESAYIMFEAKGGKMKHLYGIFSVSDSTVSTFCGFLKKCILEYTFQSLKLQVVISSCPFNR